MGIFPTANAAPGGPEAAVPPESAGLPGDSDARERSIPIRPGDLVRLLLAEPGLGPAEKLALGQFCRLLRSVFHYEFHDWLVELKELYAPLDPDSDCIDIEGGSLPLRGDVDEDFLQAFESALIRANYRRLNLEIIERAVEAPNEQGLNYVPNFKLFEHMAVYARGNTRVERFVRNIATGFRKRTVAHDGYQRLVVALKFRPGHEKVLGDYARDDVLYLRLFKDVPYVDMEMHLPEQGTKVKMRAVDKVQIASPFITFPATLAVKAFGATLNLLAMPTLAIGAIMTAPLTAGVNAFFGFQRAKQKHLYKMIRHLYYLTLANNASVITKVIDSAEDEEFKEALLGYFFLWRGSEDREPWDEARLDAAVEGYLRAKTGQEIDFESNDALQKLVRLGLVQVETGGYLLATPIDQALAHLDAQWDDYFRYNARILDGAEGGDQGAE